MKSKNEMLEICKQMYSLEQIKKTAEDMKRYTLAMDINKDPDFRQEVIELIFKEHPELKALY